MIGLIILMLVISGLLLWYRQSVRVTEPQYQTAQVETGTIIQAVSASGNVLVANIVDVTTEASGTINQVLVKDGDSVVKGQKIAGVTLDTQGLQNQAQAYASYLSAKNAVDSTTTSLWTLESAMWQANQAFINKAVDQNLAQTDPVFIETNRDWLAAEAKYKSQQQVIAQTKAALTSAWYNYQVTQGAVIAPQAGIVTGVAIAPGMQIGSTDSSSGNRLSQRVAAIETGTKPLVSLTVSEIDVTSVEPDQKVTVSLENLPDTTFTGKVVSVDKIGTSSSGVSSYPIIVALDTDSTHILPNMSVSANIMIVTKNDTLLVPASAVTEQNGQSTVQVLDNGQLRTVLVETGLNSDTQIEITSGLTVGETVVTGTTTITNTGQQSVFGGAPGGFRMIR